MNDDAKKTLDGFIDRAIDDVRKNIASYEDGISNREKWIKECNDTIVKCNADIEGFRKRIEEERSRLESLDASRRLLESMP